MGTAQVTFAVERCGATGSHVMHAQPFPAFFLTIVVVQNIVPWLPEVTQGHVNLSGFPWVCACQPEVAEYPP